MNWTRANPKHLFQSFCVWLDRLIKKGPSCEFCLYVSTRTCHLHPVFPLHLNAACSIKELVLVGGIEIVLLPPFDLTLDPTLLR